MFTVLRRAAIFAAILAAGVATGAAAQTTAADPHHPDANTEQATPPSEAGDTAGQSPTAQPSQPGMMGQDMMGRMMHSGAMGGMPLMPMHGHMMKIMFAIADEDGDGGLSFEEVTTIHRRIFDKVDGNKDGRVTPEEAQSFMRE